MLIVILLYDQLLFRPLVAWVDRFRVEQEPNERVPESWALTMMRRSRIIQAVTLAFHKTVFWTSRLMKRTDKIEVEEDRPKRRSLDLFMGVAYRGGGRGGPLAHRRRAGRPTLRSRRRCTCAASRSSPWCGYSS